MSLAVRSRIQTYIEKVGKAGLENVALICSPTGPPGNFPELNSIAQP